MMSGVGDVSMNVRKSPLRSSHVSKPEACDHVLLLNEGKLLFVLLHRRLRFRFGLRVGADQLVAHVGE